MNETKPIARAGSAAAFPHDGVEANPEALSAIIKAGEQFSIIASQDIVDVRGIKLWGKGQPVSQALQQRLLERKLQQPLEACLMAEDGVTAFSLLEQLEALLAQDTALSIGLRRRGSVLVEQLKRLPLHSVAQLLLTTALATRPHTLPHAVQAMALAGALACEVDASVDVRLAMLGGLLHDVGEVYVQPAYLDSSQSLDLVGHKHQVVHPRVAQMLLATTTDYPEALCCAIGEHHERLDGSGYPARLVGPRISPLGQMLAVVELTLGILRSQPAPLTQSSFALRVVPGEFAPRYTRLVCNLARTAGESLPLDAQATEARPLRQIDLRLQQAQALGQALLSSGSAGGRSLVDLVLTRLARLRTAWNALGCWGLEQTELATPERMELQMAGKELSQRLRELQRECLLLAERLDPEERAQLAPLWQGLLPEA